MENQSSPNDAHPVDGTAEAVVVLAQGQALRYDGVADFAAVADAPDLDPPATSP